MAGRTERNTTKAYLTVCRVGFREYGPPPRADRRPQQLRCEKSGPESGYRQPCCQEMYAVTESTCNWWVSNGLRDRRRGPRLKLEADVRLQTPAMAEAYGLYDCGLLATCMRADVNVIDFEQSHLHAPQAVRDLLAGCPWHLRSAPRRRKPRPAHRWPHGCRRSGPIGRVLARGRRHSRTLRGRGS